MQRAETLVTLELLGVISLALFAAMTSVASVQKHPYLVGSPPTRYINPTFGLKVFIPSGMLACPSDTGATTSHGFWIPLAQSASCTGALPEGPFISLLVGFETAHDAQSTRELADAVCGRGVTEIPDLQIPGQETQQCQQPYLERDKQGRLAGSADRVRTTALTLIGGLSGIDLEVSLITAQSDFTRDIEELKRVLSGVDISPRLPK